MTTTNATCVWVAPPYPATCSTHEATWPCRLTCFRCGKRPSSLWSDGRASCQPCQDWLNGLRELTADGYDTDGEPEPEPEDE